MFCGVVLASFLKFVGELFLHGYYGDGVSFGLTGDGHQHYSREPVHLSTNL